MSVTPSQPGETIDVRPLGIAFDDAKTSVLVETESMKMIRMVMPAGKVLSEHKAPGVITVQCLEGKIAFTTRG